MINYIKKNFDNRLDISINNNLIIKDMTIQKYLNQYLYKKLTDFYCLEKTTKKLFNFKAKPPIFIDKKTLLMCIKSYRLDESLYINYFSVKSYNIFDKYVIIEYISNHTMKIKEKYAFLTQIRRCREIIDFMYL